MTLPAKKKRSRMMVRLPSTIISPGHCKWVRSTYQCAIAGKHECVGVTETHHMETRGSGGGDETVVPLCSAAHREWHDKGRFTFARFYMIDLDKMAADLWQADSYHRMKYERAKQLSKGDGG